MGITIGKALEILKELNIDRWRELEPEKQEAVNLGIEALKRIDRQRHAVFPIHHPALKGEDIV